MMEAVAFSDDGRFLAVGSLSVKVYRLVKPPERRVLLGHEGSIHHMSFDTRRPHLVSGGADGFILWDLQNGQAKRSLPHKLSAKPEHVVQAPVAFSPRGDRLAATTAFDKRSPPVRLFDGLMEREVGLLPNPRDIRFLSFDAVGTRLLGIGSGLLVVWDTEKAELVRRWDFPEKAWPDCACFLSKGSQVVVGRQDGRLQIMDVASGKVVRETTLPDGILRLAPAADERQVAIVLSGMPLHVLRLPDLHVLGRYEAPAENFFLAATFHPDSRFLLTGTSGREVMLWDTQSGRSVCAFPEETRSVIRVAFSADGHYLGIVSAGNPRITLYDMRLLRSYLAKLRLDWAQP
jgi:WD40 repeat protein